VAGYRSLPGWGNCRWMRLWAAFTMASSPQSAQPWGLEWSASSLSCCELGGNHWWSADIGTWLATFRSMTGPPSDNTQAAQASPLSYVLVAETVDQVHEVAQWLREHPLSDKVEVIVSAPARVMASIPGRLMPSWVRTASAINPPNRNAIKMAGAAETTGLVVIVIDCEDDFASRLRDPFAPIPAADADSGTDLHRFIGDVVPPAVEVMEKTHRSR
jgi:hypothetical protein